MRVSKLKLFAISGLWMTLLLAGCGSGVDGNTYTGRAYCGGLECGVVHPANPHAGITWPVNLSSVCREDLCPAVRDCNGNVYATVYKDDEGRSRVKDVSCSEGPG